MIAGKKCTYEGPFNEASKRHGKGKIVWHDKGNEFDGWWSEGQINGNGEYKFSEGRTYNGQYQNN